MIQQSTAPVACARRSGPYQSLSQNSRDSLSAGVTSFIKSLHPGYASGSIQTELPTFCADSPEKGGLPALERTELAARVVSAYAALPVDVATCIGFGASCTAFGRWVASILAALLTEKAVSDDEGNARVRKKQQHRTTCHQSAQLPKTAIGLGAVSCLGMVGAAPASDHKHWINVNDSSVLGKIGRDPAYPLDGRYRQGVDIDASGLSKPIGNETHPFIGEYDGRCHSVDKLGHCFVQKLDGNGRIDNVRFTRADIVSSEKAGVVACELSGHGALGNIEVERSFVGTYGRNAPAGIGAGSTSRNTLIEGFSTFNCTTMTGGRNSDAGGVAGVAYGTIDNTRLKNAWVETLDENSDAGGGAGLVDGLVNNTMMIHGNVITHKSHAYAGGGAGQAADGAVIDNTVLASTGLMTEGDLSSVGGGAGLVGGGATVDNTLIVRSRLQTHGSHADAGGGGGSVAGTVISTTMVDGEVETLGRSAGAAVGAGHLDSHGRLYHTTGRGVVIRTSGEFSPGAVGVGDAEGVVEGVVCFESHVNTSNENSDAGFGAGWLSGSIVNVIASSCNAYVSGYESKVGFGSAHIMAGGNSRNLTVLNSSVEATGEGARQCIGGGGLVLVCDSSVGNKNESIPGCNDQTYNDCRLIAKDTCKLADRRVLMENCQPVAPPYFDAEKGSDFVCPALPNSTAGAVTTLSPTTGAPSSLATDASSLTTTGTSSPAITYASSLTTAGTSSPATTGASSSATSSAWYKEITPVPPIEIETNATSAVSVDIANHTTLSLMPVASPVPLVLSAPIAATSAGAIAGGIAAGVVVLGLAAGAGYALYRHYYPQRRPEVAMPLSDFDEL